MIGRGFILFYLLFLVTTIVLSRTFFLSFNINKKKEYTNSYQYEVENGINKVKSLVKEDKKMSTML